MKTEKEHRKELWRVLGLVLLLYTALVGLWGWVACLTLQEITSGQVSVPTALALGGLLAGGICGVIVAVFSLWILWRHLRLSKDEEVNHAPD